MKLLTFQRDGALTPGVLTVRDGRDVIVDLARADASLPGSVRGILEAGSSALAKAEAAAVDATDVLDPASVSLAAPIPNPGKILCIGLNYADHAAESGQPLPDYPIVFSKYSNTVIGSGQAIILPRVTDKVDYEAELGFVIGIGGRHISEANALDHVAGYMPINDVSARDYQERVSQWTMGKSFDTFAPMGPALVTADEVGDPHELAIRLWIGDEALQDSNTSQLIFSVPKLVADISEVMTLEPGDIVSTGTPPGVGAARRPPRFLRAGETCNIEIEKLGILSNPIVAEARTD
ncbi:MAG: fumarylacetoacetate hydrolase family protein [Chloroflexi bacterium]|nr:fumarylacetoacetate hydrolase family protein [Chloroflexota bacterium]